MMNRKHDGVSGGNIFYRRSDEEAFIINDCRFAKTIPPSARRAVFQDDGENDDQENDEQKPPLHGLDRLFAGNACFPVRV